MHSNLRNLRMPTPSQSRHIRHIHGKRGMRGIRRRSGSLRIL